MKTPIIDLKAFCAHYRKEDSVAWYKSYPAKRNVKTDMHGYISDWNNRHRKLIIDYDDLDEMVANFLGSIKQ